MYTGLKSNSARAGPARPQLRKRGPEYADVPVKKLRDRLLVKGVDLCVTGVLGQFAGLGHELLPRTGKDIRRARPGRENSCRR